MCECVSFIPLASVSGCPLPQCVCVLVRTMYVNVCVWEGDWLCLLSRETFFSTIMRFDDLSLSLVPAFPPWQAWQAWQPLI